MDKVILNIGTFTSRCMACNKDALPDEITHETAPPGYSGRETEKGCEKKFTHVTSDYVGLFDVSEMRPDLEYIHPMEAHEDMRSENAS